MQGYFTCFIWPQRQGFKGKHGIYRTKQGIYEKQIPANSQSYFSIHLVYSPEHCSIRRYHKVIGNTAMKN